MNKFTIKLLILAILLSFANYNINAQHRNDFEAGASNVAFGGFVGGIGAIINKKPNEKTGKVFLKGFVQGALGGYLIFESKRLVGKFGKTGDYGYVWPSKIVNSAGVSILENAAANRDLWERWHLNIGFNRIELNTKEEFKVSYRIMPFALGNTFRGISRGKLNFKESIRVGSFVFFTDDLKIGKNAKGASFSNSILIENQKLINMPRVMSHELIHGYQYESLVGFNAYLDKPLKSLAKKNKWYNIYKKIFYTDFNYLTFTGAYLLYPKYESNFFEKEAQYYTE